MLGHVQLLVTLLTVAHQAPLSMGFSRQEYWSGLPCLPPGGLPNSGTAPVSPMSLALANRFFTTCLAACTPPSPKSHIYWPSSLPLWSSFSELWNAVSWAIVLILPQIKLNLQLSHCAFCKRKYHTSFYTSPTAHWSLEVLDGWDLFYLYTLTATVPTPVFLPGESQGWGSLVSCRLWGHTESDTIEVT